MKTIKLHKFIALLLVFSVLFGGLSYKSVAKAEDNTVSTWFSSQKNGNEILYMEKNNPIYVNYNYTGSSNTNITIDVKKDGTLIYQQTYTGIKSGSFYLEESKVGLYELSVIIEDNSEIYENTSTLSVVENLHKITKQPQNLIINKGMDVIFETDCDDANASYQWYNASSKEEVGTAVSGASDKKMVITTANLYTLSNTYFYCVVAANGVELKTDYALLTVKGIEQINNSEPPSATNNPNVTLAVTTKPNQDQILKPTATPVNFSQNKTKVKANIKFSITKKNIIITMNKAASYRIYRSNDGKKYKLSKNVVGKSYTDKKVQLNKKYYYKVYEMKRNKVAGISKVLSVATKANPTIQKFTARKKGSSIKVAWKFNQVKAISVYVDTGNGFKRLGNVSGIKRYCIIAVPDGYSNIKIRIRGYNQIKKKKYYSKYSKTIRIRI